MKIEIVKQHVLKRHGVGDVLLQPGLRVDLEPNLAAKLVKDGVARSLDDDAKVREEDDG